MDNMMTSEQILLSSINMANLAVNMPESLKLDILQKYETLAQAKAVNNNSIVNDNMFNFQVLMNKTLFLTLVQTRKPVDLAQYTNLNNMLQLAIKDCGGNRSISAFNKLYNELSKDITTNGGTINLTPSADDVQTAIQTFGVEHVEDEGNLDNIEDIDNIDTDISDDDLLGVDTDELFDVDDPELEDSDISVGDESAFAEDEIDLDNEEETTETNEDKAVDDTESKKEARENVQKLYEAQINQVADTLVKILSALYKNGFDAMPQEGLYINNNGNSPLIKLDKSNNIRTESDCGSIYDFRVMKAIMGLYPQLGMYYPLNKNEKGSFEAVPSFKYLAEKSAVCHMLHLQFQSANIDYCTGKNSIHTWITETQLKDSGCANAEEWIKTKNHGSRRLTSFKKMVQPWYRWCIKNLIVDSLVEFNVTSLEDFEKATGVIETINRALRNVVVVQERNINKKKNTAEKTDIKISTSTGLDSQAIINALESTLNIAGNSSIKVKELAHENFEMYGVLTLSIEYDADAANASDLFAYEIVDKLIESGNTPSWSNALLGKKEDGTYFFWDNFMGSAEPFRRNYTIYAGSRSGKGVMTSTLIASALCDRKHVFYTDGKPENGACLGEIAWKEGKEAYVFDGQAMGKRPFGGYMETYTNGMRQPDEVASYIEKCPRKLFENRSYFTSEGQKKFLGVMRYLKSLQLCATIVAKRAGGDLPADDWQIWVFDEMTDMSNNEMFVREQFARYARQHTGAKELSPDDTGYYKIDLSKAKKEQMDPSSDKYDEGLDYIQKWVKWTSSIRHLTSNMSTISMGKANMNIIFIFQEATWIQEHKKITTIGKVVAALKSTKIVGRNALANACGEYGDANTQKAAWYSKVNSGGGWWAISESADLRNSSVTTFKPYKVWTTPLIPGTDDRDPNGDFDNPKYLAGYIGKLLGSIGVSAADLLQESFDYANQAVQTIGYAGSLKEYIYDCTNFAVNMEDNSYDNLHNELNGENCDEEEDVISTFNYTDTPTGFSDSDDDTLDFGTPAGVDTGAPQTISNMTDEDAFADFGGGQTRPASRQETAIPNFTKTSVLMSKNFSDEALMGYFNKYRLSQKLMTNSYNYSDRTPQTNTRGLALAVIIIGNYVYITEKLGLGQQQVIANAYNNINAGRNGDYSYSFLLGIIDSLKDGSLQYDKMPTQDQMRVWASKYIAVQQGNTGQSFGQQAQTQNPIDTSDVQNEQPSSNMEDIGARVLRLSQQICIERNWTAQQLIDFQNQVLLQMGVQ